MHDHIIAGSLCFCAVHQKPPRSNQFFADSCQFLID
jgi:hypothetical protein